MNTLSAPTPQHPGAISPAPERAGASPVCPICCPIAFDGCVDRCPPAQLCRKHEFNPAAVAVRELIVRQHELKK